MNPFEPGTAWSRRNFLKLTAAGLTTALAGPFRGNLEAATAKSHLYWVDQIPDLPYIDPGHPNYHAGVEALLGLMGGNGLKFYRSATSSPLAGSQGIIAPDDVVLIKVNAQWKYRGCTNSDVIRGLIQRILDHPDGFSGEVVIFENGQGRGSLACDTSSSYGGDTSVHANANDENQSFEYLAGVTFAGDPVSTRLMDPIRGTFLAAGDHTREGFRHYQNVSYPCFNTAGGRRVELKQGIWTGGSYSQKLKLINVPVLKHHDTGGSEITASLKHFYGVVSMSDGYSGIRHYGKLGKTCGKMVVSVRTPVLNIIDAIWTSYASITGTPAPTTFRTNTLAASQDPVALDTWAAKNILYPIDNNPRHLPTFSGVKAWLVQAKNIINVRGGLYDAGAGIQVRRVTNSPSGMIVHHASAETA
jgi:uncharacterized protein (DUF362 family)